jgi:outer membrane biosynthesis protein TonB
VDSNRHSPGPLRALWRRWGGWALGAGVLLLAAGLLWHLLSDTAAQRREAPRTALLTLPPPPPPPPPPEPEKRPDPEPVKPEKIVEPTPTPEKPADKPMDDAKAPDAAKDLGDPVTIAGDAQAGNDAFGIQAGRGGGTAGTGTGGGGLGGASYARYVSSRLQQALSRDPRTRQLAFEDLRLDLWLDAAGKPSRVELVQGSGTSRTDGLVLAVLRELEALDERPPASMRYPMRVSMKGVRP